LTFTAGILFDIYRREIFNVVNPTFLKRGGSMHGRPFCSLLRVLSILLIVSIVGLCSASALAQGSGRDSTGTGGNHTITGKIFFSSGRKAEGAIQVKLQSYNTPDISVIADSSGSFVFSNISPGTYTVEVNAGREFEIVREQVTVDADLPPPPGMPSIQASRRYTVMITLQPKAAATNGKPSVINAELAQVPDEARALYEKALTLSQSGDTAKAINNLKAAVSIFPQFPLALNELGVNYLKMGDAHRALEPLRSATKLKPDAFSPKLNLGIALLETHQFSDADTQLREALKISSTPAAHMYLGLTLIGVKRYDEAQRELETSIANGGEKLGQAHKYLGGIYWEKHEYERAAVEFENYLRLTPNAPDAERIRGTIKELRGK
jgi:Tfp pilus assembly protein PilF